MCCQVQVSATDLSLVQSSSTDCGASLCDQETSNTRRLKPATKLWKYNHSGLQRQENKQPEYLLP
jgi:hypothetical protein